MHLLIKLIHILRNKFLNSWQIDQKMLKLLQSTLIKIILVLIIDIVHVKGLLDCFVFLTNVHMD